MEKVGKIPEIITVFCPEIEVPVFTDRKFSEVFWERGYKTDKFYKRSVIISNPDFGKTYPESNFKTEICLGRDKNFLYIGVKCFDNEKEKIKFEHKENQGEIHLDDSIELFFDINHNHSEYYQLIINGEGYYSSFHRGKSGRKKFWNVNLKTKKIEVKDGWGIEIAIDIKSFKKAITKNSVWGFNAGRNFSAGDWEKRIPASLSPLHYNRWDIPSRFSDLYFTKTEIVLKNFFINGKSVFFNDKNIFISPQIKYGNNKLKIKITNRKKSEIEIIIKTGKEKEKFKINSSHLLCNFFKKYNKNERNKTIEIILKKGNRTFFIGRWDISILPLFEFKENLIFPEKSKIILNADNDFIKGKKIILQNNKIKKILKGRKELKLNIKNLSEINLSIIDKKGEILNEKKIHLKKIPHYLKPSSFEKKHPFLFKIDPSLIRKEKRLKIVYEKIKKEVDSFIKKPSPLPLQSCASLTLYRCFKHGARLINLGNGRHRCPVDGEILEDKLLDYSYLFWEHGKNFSIATFSSFLYLIEKKQKYLKIAKRILLFYSRNYDKFQYNISLFKENFHSGVIRDSILVESDLITMAAFTFDMIYNYLNEKERKIIKDGLLIPSCEKMMKFPGGKGNWKTHLNLALVSTGLVLRNEDFVQAGIGNERGFLFDMEKCVTKGGFWHQGAIGYHFYVLTPYTHMAEILLKSLNINLYKNKKFQKMFLAPVLFSFPDGSFPNIGTGGGGKISDYSPLYEISGEKVPALKPFIPYLVKFLSYDKEEGNELLLLTNEKRLKKEKYEKTKSSKTLPSVNFPEIGYGILRDGKEKIQQLVFVYGKSHHGKGQPDKLSFSLFGDGKLLSPDPGYLSYTHPLTPSWYYRTIAHTTVVVDFKNQNYGQAPLLCYFDGEIKVVGATSSNIYQGIEANRIMVLKKNILIDFFILKGDKKHIFDYFIHHYGKIKIREKMVKINEPILQVGGYQHIKEIRKSKEKKNLWKVEWILYDKSKTISYFYSSLQSEIYSGNGPRYGGDIKSKKEIKPIPLIFLRCNGNLAIFSSIMEIGVKRKKIKNVKFLKNSDFFSIKWDGEEIKFFNEKIEYKKETVLKIPFEKKFSLFPLK